MLNLSPAILAAVVTEAERSAAQHPRWLAAISRAAVELAENPYIEAQDDHTLLIGSPSGNAYIGNGSCQCRAFEVGQPCWHRAAERLYHRYVEAEAAPVTEHISVQARKAYAAANGPRPPHRLSIALRKQRPALGEERAVLEEQRRIRQIAAARATALMNEAFA